MADLPTPSPAGVLGNGFFHGTDPSLSNSLRVCGLESFAPPGGAFGTHPTMAWGIQQLREAMPLGVQPSYLFRDNDGIYGEAVSRFLVGSGIEEIQTAYRSPWQNPFAERSIGTLRRELLDHVIVLNAEDLKRLLKEYVEEYYHPARPHQG